MLKYFMNINCLTIIRTSDEANKRNSHNIYILIVYMSVPMNYAY